MEHQRQPAATEDRPADAPPSTGTDPDVLPDTGRLAAWLDDHGLAPGAPLRAERIRGGTSNVMFDVRRGSARFVLRRPAAVAAERAAEGLRREYRLLRALEGTDVPHPAAIALCEDTGVIGCVFHLMEHVDGYPPLDPRSAEPGPQDVAFAMADALARLHAVDWRGIGLGDFGRPGFHARQVRRWSGQLEREGGRDFPGAHAVAAWLAEHRPTDEESEGATLSLMHGDYHVANVIMAPRPPATVAAIVDWETATIGDPLLDLAVFRFLCAGTDRRPGPSADELAERYRLTAGHDRVPDLTYHDVLARFRHAVLLEGVHQRSRRDPTAATNHGHAERAATYMADALRLTGRA